MALQSLIAEITGAIPVSSAAAKVAAGMRLLVVFTTQTFIRNALPELVFSIAATRTALPPEMSSASIWCFG